MGYTLYRQVNSSIGKNLSWYSPIGAWLTIALVALVQIKLKWPKYWTYGLLLIVDSLREFELLLSSSRKFLPFRSNA